MKKCIVLILAFCLLIPCAFAQTKKKKKKKTTQPIIESLPR